MIIGKNNPNSFTQKKQSFYGPQQENKPINNLPKQQETVRRFTDATNKNDMADKSFAMLQERYENGLLTLEEFNKKCRNLEKFRKK